MTVERKRNDPLREALLTAIKYEIAVHGSLDLQRSPAWLTSAADRLADAARAALAAAPPSLDVHDEFTSAAMDAHGFALIAELRVPPYVSDHAKDWADCKVAICRHRLRIAAALAASGMEEYDTENGPTTQQVADSRFLERESQPLTTGAAPGTAAGRALLDRHVLDSIHDIPHASLRAALLAIEAEARQQGREEERERVRVALHAVAMEPSRFGLLWDKELDAILDAREER